MRIFTLELDVLPFVGCMQRSSYVHSFFLTVLAPPAFVWVMVMLQKSNIQSRHEVWRNSVYVLFLVYPTTCETIVNAFRCYKLPDGRRYLLEDFNILCNGLCAHIAQFTGVPRQGPPIGRRARVDMVAVRVFHLDPQARTPSSCFHRHRQPSLRTRWAFQLSSGGA